MTRVKILSGFLAGVSDAGEWIYKYHKICAQGIFPGRIF